MAFLQSALDDPDPRPCGRCSVCTGELPAPGVAPSSERVEHARRHVRGVDVVVDPRKRWPAGCARRGVIHGAAEGRAVAFGDDPGWSEELAELARRGDEDVAPPALLDAVVDTLRRWSASWPERPVAVIAMPTPEHGASTRSLAEHVGSIGTLPVLDVLTWQGAPVGSDLASAAIVSHLESALGVARGSDLPAGPVLLVAATMRTGWAITVAAALLRETGTGPVLPLVLHRRP